MFATLPRRQWLLQVVLVTLLAALLAPTLSRALDRWHGQVSPWAEICATPGADAPSGSGSEPVSLKHLLEHCPMCSLQADSPGAPPVAASGLTALALREGLPVRFGQAAHTTHAWTVAQPRAPPAAS